MKIIKKIQKKKKVNSNKQVKVNSNHKMTMHQMLMKISIKIEIITHIIYI